MKQSGIKATTFRTFMIVTIFIIIGLSTFGFYYAKNWINKFAIEVNSTAPQSTTNNDNVQVTKQLKDSIAENQVVANKAISIVTTSQDYRNKTTQDLNKYASDTGVSIASYDFEKSAATKTVTKTSRLINGVQSNLFTVTLDNPVPFTNLMRFLKSIESNLPKIQIKDIDISRVPNSDDTVTIKPLTLEVYTK
jgi:hypothetical protein